jgi:hypothetical protein
MNNIKISFTNDINNVEYLIIYLPLINSFAFTQQDSNYVPISNKKNIKTSLKDIAIINSANDLNYLICRAPPNVKTLDGSNIVTLTKSEVVNMINQNFINKIIHKDNVQYFIILKKLIQDSEVISNHQCITK